MVAVSTISDPFPPPAEWVAARRASQVLLTIKDVDAMVNAGIVPEDATLNFCTVCCCTPTVRPLVMHPSIRKSQLSDST